MSRKSDRRHALNLLFEWEFNKDTAPAESVTRYFERKTFLGGARLPDEADVPFVEKLFAGTVERIGTIDGLISLNAEGWELTRLMKTDLSILRLAIFEILYNPDIPAKVSINEAVELARLYSGDDSPSFVNGVLAQIIRAERGS